MTTCKAVNSAGSDQTASMKQSDLACTVCCDNFVPIFFDNRVVMWLNPMTGQSSVLVYLPIYGSSVNLI